MELLLQSKVNLLSIKEERKELIELEGLHINDKLSYERIQYFHKKYGNGFSEKDFARYFLDIDNERYYAIQVGKHTETDILSREMISNDEFNATQRRVIEQYKLTSESEITYDEFIQMYNKFCGPMSIKIFAEEVLGIKYSTLKNAYYKGKKIKVFDKSILPRNEADRIRDKIFKEENIHVCDRITLDKFEELYRKFGEGMSEENFSERVLGMASNSLKKLKSGNSTKSVIFITYIINPQIINVLREKVIKEEKLHIGDVISDERFEELYRKYAWILSREIFAEDVLDISLSSFKNMKKGTNSVILNNIDVPKEYIDELRTQIISENNLEQNMFINYKRMQELYKQYGGVLSERQFAVLVLEISVANYNSFKNRENSNTNILKNSMTTDFEALRRKVIEENNLHYDDRITYSRLQELHQKYAPNMKEHIFAREILDIPEKPYQMLKSNKGGYRTRILLQEPLPDDEEMEIIRRKLIRENKLHTKDMISYVQFRELYIKYGGVLPENIFAIKMLDISAKNLPYMRNDPDKSFQVLLRTTMSQEEIATLKETIILENELYPARELTLEEMRRIYISYNHTLSFIDFAREILEVSLFSLQKINQGVSKSARVLYITDRKPELDSHVRNFSDDEVEKLKTYLSKGFSNEQIATRLRVDKNTLRINLEALFKYERLTEEEISMQRINVLYAEGNGAEEISKITGINLDAVNNRILQIEDCKRKKEKLRKNREDEEQRIRLIEIAKVKAEEARRRAEAAKKRAEQREKLEAEALRNKEIAREKLLKKYSTNQKKVALEKRVKRINGNVSSDKKHIASVRDYIELCKIQFEDNKFNIKSLDILEDSIFLIEGDIQDIAFFSKVCIFFGQYRRAANFISVITNNESIDFEETEQLDKLKKSINYAIRKQSALNMIIKGNREPSNISLVTGVLEADIIRMIRNYYEGRVTDGIPANDISFCREELTAVK